MQTEMARLIVAFRNFAHDGPHVVLAAEGRYTAIRVQQQMANSINICVPHTLYSNIQLSEGLLTFIFNKSTNFL